MKEGQKGFWIGEVPESETEALKTIHDAAYNRTVERMNIALEVMDWVVGHQSTGERIATLNTQQQRWAQRWDKTGMLYLPSFVERWNK